MSMVLSHSALVLFLVIGAATYSAACDKDDPMSPRASCVGGLIIGVFTTLSLITILAQHGLIGVAP